jgi:hypothetical protein
VCSKKPKNPLGKPAGFTTNNDLQQTGKLFRERCYAWATPPSFLPTAMYDEELKAVKAAFAEMQRLDAQQMRRAR